MPDRINNVMEALVEDAEFSAEETEKLQKLREILSDEEFVEHCLNSVSELLKEHGLM